MSDPISGAGGGAAKLAMKQLQQMQQQQQMQQTPVKPNSGQSAFANKMQTQQVQQTQQAQKVAETQNISQSVRPKNIRPTNTQQTQRVQDVKKGEAGRFNRAKGTQSPQGMGQGLARFLQGMDSRKSNVDELVKKAMSGKSFNNKELLVLQYKVSQFSLEMDLTSKVVDKTTGGIKQAMNTQV